jgi:hypothetical protein
MEIFIELEQSSREVWDITSMNEVTVMLGQLLEYDGAI